MSRNTSVHVSLADTRNMGIVAHVDAGKTTTTECILYLGGEKHRIGKVDDGDTTTDSMAQEQERGITIQAAAAHLAWKKYFINLIDTPGHVDFTMDVERSLRVLDGAVVVLCASGGVQPQTRTVWRQANKYGVPRVIFVNKMDKLGADFDRVISQVIAKLNAKPVAVQMPIGKESEFVGVIDLMTMRSYIWDNEDKAGSTYVEGDVPDELREKAQEARKSMVEAIAETDDSLLERYLMDEELTADELKAALRKAVIAQTLVPVLCGSAFKHKGVEQLLDAAVEYLPSPLDVPPVKATLLADGSECERHTSDNEPLAALAFKIIGDVNGNLTFVRVYSGVLKSGSYVYNSAKRKNERISRIVKLQGVKREEVDALHAGDIGACLGLKVTTTGDTLCDDNQPVALESISCPEPVIWMAVEAKDRDSSREMGEALAKLSVQDPSFRVRTDQETGQTVIGGQGELHLEIMVDRLKREFDVQVSTGEPQVSYRETIRRSAKGVGKYIRQNGGHGAYGHAEIELEPLPTGTGFEFVNAITGGVVPQEYIRPIEQGIREALETGAVAGFPVVDVKVTLVFGSTHAVDSSADAYKVAGSMAFKDALAKAQPVMLEPVMTLQVEVPEQYMGDIMGDVSQRRGKVSGFDTLNGTTTVQATVPLAEMFGYSTALRSKTQGQGISDPLELSHYEQVPASIAEEVKAKATA